MIAAKPAGEMSYAERWAVYLEYLTDRSKRSTINEIVGQEEGIAMASEVLLTVSRDEEERASIMRDEKIELDYQSYMTWAKEEGHAKGLAEGKAEGQAAGRAEGLVAGRTEGLVAGRAEGWDGCQNFVLELFEQGLTTEEIKQRLEQKT